jgi:CRISPR-associated endonuclease/helicase Cas3
MEVLDRSPGARLISFVIAGHHAGLSNWQDLKARLARPEKRPRWESARVLADAPIQVVPEVELPSWIGPSVNTDDFARSFEFLVRMCFSALVDADFLDTESFVDRTEQAGRLANRRVWRSLSDYEPVIEAHFSALGRLPPTPVIAQRQRVLEWCRSAAGGPRGAYSLTVPTGGGKTLSSLAFALRHAAVHGHHRVIVASPFLSILDQTADVYRDVFEPTLGRPVLVEHHSNVEAERDTRVNRLATENWDAPLVVTTQVQLFESLFANRPGACRKLHNVANSIIVLDEVQSLPVGLLDPMLDVLQQLRTNYGSTLLLTTATQPAFHRRSIGGWPEPKPWLDPAPTEIVPAAELPGLFSALERVRVEWPAAEEKTEWPDLAYAIAQERQVLAIVHRREDARVLWEEVDQIAPGTMHLSARMCPAHRREVLARIRSVLDSGGPCRVVSTQVVEAGVDLDFPVVFRAMAGLEALAQSAGRCNREGKLATPGRFSVFNSITEPPKGLQPNRDVARTMLRAEPNLSLTSPETFRAYFDRLYALKNATDSLHIQASRAGLMFKKVAEDFRMIDDATTTVFIPWRKSGKRAIDVVRYAGPNRERMRALQPFGVSVFPHTLRELAARGLVETLHETITCLLSDEYYHPVVGLDDRPDGFRAHFA